MEVSEVTNGILNEDEYDVSPSQILDEYEDNGIAAPLPQVFTPEPEPLISFAPLTNFNQPFSLDQEKSSENCTNAFFNSLIYWHQPMNTIKAIIITLVIAFFTKNYHLAKFFSGGLALFIVLSLILLKLLSLLMVLSSNETIFPMGLRLTCLSWTHEKGELITQAKLNKWIAIITDGLEDWIRQFVRIILIEDQNRSITYLFCAVTTYIFSSFFSTSSIICTVIIISLTIPKLYDMNKVAVDICIEETMEILREWYNAAHENAREMINVGMPGKDKIKKEQ